MKIALLIFSTIVASQTAFAGLYSCDPLVDEHQFPVKDSPYYMAYVSGRTGTLRAETEVSGKVTVKTINLTEKQSDLGVTTYTGDGVEFETEYLGGVESASIKIGNNTAECEYVGAGRCSEETTPEGLKKTCVK